MTNGSSQIVISGKQTLVLHRFCNTFQDFIVSTYSIQYLWRNHTPKSPQLSVWMTLSPDPTQNKQKDFNLTIGNYR